MAVFIGSACATNVAGFCRDGTSPSGMRDYDFVDDAATMGWAESSTERPGRAGRHVRAVGPDLRRGDGRGCIAAPSFVAAMHGGFVAALRD
ncbi:MAG: hypothetical protein WCJ30_17005 [Deltaproteobacteria bacterium]